MIVCHFQSVAVHMITCMLIAVLMHILSVLHCFVCVACRRHHLMKAVFNVLLFTLVIILVACY